MGEEKYNWEVTENDLVKHKDKIKLQTKKKFGDFWSGSMEAKTSKWESEIKNLADKKMKMSP